MASITDQLVELRRAYTGENLSQAVPAVRAAAGIPEAGTEAQRHLEAQLLIAACTASSYLQFRPPASIIRPAHVFTAIEPEECRLHLAEAALGPLLYEVLPRMEDGYPMGIAGLTHGQHRRSASLRLGDAEVVLAGVTADDWARAMRYVHWMIDFRGLPTVLDVTSRQPEFRDVTSRPGSAVLRRIGLFREASWLRVLPGEQWWLDWAGGPAEAAISEAFKHPVFGTAERVQLRRQDVPATDIDPEARTWPWPDEFVSAVTS